MMECGSQMKALQSGLSGVLLFAGGLTMAADPFDARSELAANPPEPPRPHSRMVLEVFKMPAAEAYELVGENLAGMVMHDRVLEAVKTGKAALERVMAAGGKAGVQLRCEQTEIYLYPTEFDPAQVPQNIALIAAKSASSKKPGPPPPGAVVSPFNAGLGIMTTTTPTAFQSQLLGETLVLEASPMDDQGRVPVSCTYDSNRLLSVRQINDIPCPLFAPRHLPASLCLRPGRPAFAGIFGAVKADGGTAAQAGDAVSLEFLTALPAPPAKPKTRREPDSPFAGATLRSIVEVVSLGKSDARALLAGHADDDELYHSVMKVAGNGGTARRETSFAARSRPGVQVELRNGDEHPYPTEFDPPQIPGHLVIASKDLLHELRAGTQSGLGAQPPVEGGSSNGGFGLITVLSCTAFQTQSLGESLEMDVTQEGPDGTVDAVVNLEINRLAGTVPYQNIQHPVFEKRRINTCVTTEPGRAVLLGTLNKAVNTGWTGSNQEDRVWLAFLRVSRG